LAAGVGLWATAAPAQVIQQQPSPYAVPPLQSVPSYTGPSFLPPDTTLAPNVQPSVPPSLQYPLFNPLRRPIRTEPLGPWQITPRIELRETFDSNPTAAPRPLASRPDGYTTLIPGISVSRQTPRNTFVFDYQVEGRKYYENEGLDQIRNNLSEFSSTQLIEELLYFDTRAVIGQALVSQRNLGSASPQTQGTAETEFYNYSLSPYMRNHFGGFADSELRYSFAQNTFSGNTGGAFPNSLSNQFAGTLNSGTDFSRTLWSVTGLYSAVDRSDFSSTFVAPQFATRNLNAVAERAIGEVGAEYAITRFFSVLGTAGYESIEDPTLVKNIHGGTWSTGFRVRPTTDASFLLVYGYREDHHYWSGSIIYDYDPTTRFVARHREGLVTNDTLLRDNLGTLGVDEFGNFIDPITRRQFDPTYSLFSLTTVSFRQIRSEASFHATRLRNYYDILVYQDDRQAQITQTSDSTYGFVAAYARDLDPLTNAFVEFRYQHVKFKPDLRVDNNYGFTFGLRYALTDSVDTYANYSYLVRDSRPSINDLEDHVAFVGIRKFF
jgi:uncharacterized protein (PEP-CTERM system associated)